MTSRVNSNNFTIKAKGLLVTSSALSPGIFSNLSTKKTERKDEYMTSGSEQIEEKYNYDDKLKFTSMTSRLQNVPTVTKSKDHNQKSTPRQINSARYSTAFGSISMNKSEYISKEKIIKQLGK